MADAWAGWRSLSPGARALWRRESGFPRFRWTGLVSQKRAVMAYASFLSRFGWRVNGAGPCSKDNTGNLKRADESKDGVGRAVANEAGHAGRECVGRSRILAEVNEQWGHSRKHAMKLLGAKAGLGGRSQQAQRKPSDLREEGGRRSAVEDVESRRTARWQETRGVVAVSGVT